MATGKNLGVSVILTLLLGSFGLLYTTALGTIVMLSVLGIGMAIGMGIAAEMSNWTFNLSFLAATHFVSTIWGIMAVRRINRDQSKQSRPLDLKLQDILVTVVIALVFAIVFKVWSSVYDLVGLAGLHLDQLTYGMWFIAAPLAFLIIRKPGVALLAELAAANGEFLFGSSWGLGTLIYGFFQGLAAELIFALCRYRVYNVIVASIAAVMSGAASFFIDQYYGYIEQLEPWNLALLIGFRLLGSFLIAGVFAYVLTKALERTGVTNLVRPVAKSEYDALND